MANSLDDYPSLNRFLRIFSFSMREFNVEQGNPSAAAAPFGPDIRPRLCVRADTIIFRSCSESSSLTSSRVCGVRFEQGIDGSHELSTQNTSSGLRITDLSTMFWSSRILPGQSYDWKKSSVCLSMLLNTLRAWCAYRWRKYSSSIAISSRRSRSGGT